MRVFLLAIYYFPFLIYSQDVGYTRDLINEDLNHDPALDSASAITIDNSIMMRVDQYKKIGLSFSTGIQMFDSLEYRLNELNIGFVVNGILASSDSLVDITNKEITDYEHLSKRKVRKRYGYATRFGAFAITTKQNQ